MVPDHKVGGVTRNHNLIIKLFLSSDWLCGLVGLVGLVELVRLVRLVRLVGLVWLVWLVWFVELVEFVELIKLVEIHWNSLKKNTKVIFTSVRHKKRRTMKIPICWPQHPFRIVRGKNVCGRSMEQSQTLVRTMACVRIWLNWIGWIGWIGGIG